MSNKKVAIIILSITLPILCLSLYGSVTLPKTVTSQEVVMRNPGCDVESQIMTLVGKNVVQKECTEEYKTYFCFLDFWYYFESNSTQLNVTNSNATCIYNYDQWYYPVEQLHIGQQYSICFNQGRSLCINDERVDMASETHTSVKYVFSIIGLCVSLLVIAIYVLFLEYKFVTLVKNKCINV